MNELLTQTLKQAFSTADARLEVQPVEEVSLALLSGECNEYRLDHQAIGHLWQHMPYWAFAWAGGRALARYILAHPHLVAGKRVLDFGCGSGLVGIAAAKAGAEHVLVCDIDPNARAAAVFNAHANDVAVTPVTPDALSSAGNPALGNPALSRPASECSVLEGVDVLFASDVLYDVSSQADLAPAIAALAKTGACYLAEKPEIVSSGLKGLCQGETRDKALQSCAGERSAFSVRDTSVSDMSVSDFSISAVQVDAFSVDTLPRLDGFDRQVVIGIYRCDAIV